MKANKVLEKLNISRKTLSSYVKQGKIKTRLLNNGFYDYNEDDIIKIEREQTVKNRIIIFKNNKKFEFKLLPAEIESVLCFIAKFS